MSSSASFLGGPGLHDPCEKELTNTLAHMTDQQAEAITYSAQVRTCQFKYIVIARLHVP